MNHTKHAMFIMIYRTLVKGKKHYIQPSVDVIIELIAKRHTTSIKRRWAFQCLHDLEAAGLINRQVRYVKNPDGGYKQIPSLISITLRGARKLFDQGVQGASNLAKEILGWIHAGDKRWPQYQNRLQQPVERTSEGGLIPIKSVFAAMGVLQQIPS